MSVKNYLSLTEVLALAAVLAVSVSLTGGCGEEQVSPVSPETETPIVSFILRDVGFTTEDDVRIAASWGIPEKVERALPVVVLLHHYTRDRSQWDAFIPNLLQNGYATLAIDIRGHGESFLPGGISSTEDLERMPRDVAAAITWLKDQDAVDADRIGVIGGDIGANIAYVSSGVFKEVKTTVSLSPLFGQVLVGRGLDDFKPHSILFIATAGDSDAAASVSIMAQLTTDPKQVEIFEGSSAHGIGILRSKPEAREIVLDWLRRTL